MFDDLLGTLDYRGHDGRGRWHGGDVALGHQHRWTTPEAVGQDQPVAVADVRLALAGRLDNRAELGPALPQGQALDGTTDAELLGHAYREWGDGCLDRAVGAFALALRDARRDRFLAARDKTGIRHLFVAETAEAVVVGSDPATVRAHPAVESGRSDAALAAYLTRTPIRSDVAFDSGVRRLPHGCRLVADDDGVRTERYWHPADGPDLRGTDLATLRRHLRETLATAIRARTRSRGQPVVSMSGGLDSTSVAGVAAADLGEALPAFSMVFEDVDEERLTREERGRIRDTVARHDLPATEVVADDAKPLADPGIYDEPAADSPCLDPTQGGTDTLNRRVADAGHRVVLTGHGGNLLNGSRFAYADLLRRGRVLKLLREVRADGGDTGRMLLWYALVPTVPSLAARLSGTTGNDATAWVGPAVERTELPEPTAPERFRSLPRRLSYEAFLAPRREYKLHNAHRRALKEGVVLRRPYLDARVVELAYAIPPHDLLAGGLPKGLFRRAFGDVLPESVRSVPKGYHFDPFVAAGLRENRAELDRVLRDGRLEAEGYVAEGAPADYLDGFLDGDYDLYLPWRFYAAERWLATTDDRA